MEPSSDYNQAMPSRDYSTGSMGINQYNVHKTSGNAIGGVNNINNVSASETIKDRVFLANARLRGIIKRLADLQDRAYGPRPEVSNNGTKEMPPVGIVGHINFGLNDLEDLISQASNQLEEVERIL